MNEHAQFSDLLPPYVSGALDGDQRAAVEQHLLNCTECQADLVLWQSLAGEIIAVDRALQAPAGLVERALDQVGSRKMAGKWQQAAGCQQAAAVTTGGDLHPTLWPRRAAWPRRVWELLRSQIPLVQREIWPSSAAVIVLGFIAALVAEHAGFVYTLAPLVTAACMSLIYGPENDPAYELALSTPTSPRQILLARLVLVFGYNLALVLVAMLGLLPVLREGLLGPLLLNWLAPMTFLSAAALVLSLWIGAPNAITITYLAWLGQLLAGALRSPQAALEFSPQVAQVMAVYQDFWTTPALLLTLSALLLAMAIWLAGRQPQGIPGPA